MIPGCATSTFKLVPEWKKALGRIRKVRAICRSHNEVAGKVVMLYIRGPGSIPGWATSFFFSRFQSEKRGLSRVVKKQKAFSLCHGGVVVKAVVLKA